MLVEQIEWIDEEAKEAIVTLKNEGQTIKCFSCPCVVKLNSEIDNILECLDTKNVLISENDSQIIKKEKIFEYEIHGKLINRSEGFVNVFGMIIHIDEIQIPGDIVENMNICFSTSRIDIW